MNAARFKGEKKKTNKAKPTYALTCIIHQISETDKSEITCLFSLFFIKRNELGAPYSIAGDCRLAPDVCNLILGFGL